MASLNVPTLAALRALPVPTPPTSAVMGGYHSDGDGGGGTFYWEATSSAADDGGTVIASHPIHPFGRWLRLFDGPVNVKWWGAYGDGNNDDTTAIQAALNYVPPKPSIDRGISVFVPPGEYRVTVSLVLGLPKVTSGSVPPATPPVVTFTGTPIGVLDPIEVQITQQGALGTAQFKWTLNNGVPVAGLDTAAAVVLGTTGITAHFPSGAYTVGDTYTVYSTRLALYTVANVNFFGAGAAGGGTRILVHDASGLGAGLLVEGSEIQASAFSRIADLYFTPDAGAAPQDFIVVHAGSVKLENIQMFGVRRYGAVIASGTSGGNCLGATRLPVDTYFGSDFWMINNLEGEQCPDGATFSRSAATTTADFIQPDVGQTVLVHVSSTDQFDLLQQPGHGIVAIKEPGTPDGSWGPNTYQVAAVDLAGKTVTLKNVGNPRGTPVAPNGSNTVPKGSGVVVGALVCIYGVDTNGGSGYAVNAINCNVGIYDESQTGGTWTACYSQDNTYGYVSAAPGQAVFVKCGSEDTNETVLDLSAASLLIGGSIVGDDSQTQERIGGTSAQLTFQGLSGLDRYLVSIPNTPNASPLSFGRASKQIVSQIWELVYSEAGAYPYQSSSWQWLHLGNGPELEDQSTGPFGWTDSDNPRGSGCAIIGRPTINTRRHWTWKQTGVGLKGGQNTIYINGVSQDAGPFPFADNATLAGIGNTQTGSGNTSPMGIRPGEVQFFGVPTQVLDPIEIQITTGGDKASAQFTWTLNGGAPQGPLPTALPSVDLGSGVIVVFGEGPYDLGNTYSVRSMWTNAQCSCTVTLEFGSVANMEAAGSCSVNGICYLSHGGTSQNIACSVNVANSCTATLVWHFDVFVTNYSSGTIG